LPGTVQGGGWSWAPIFGAQKMTHIRMLSWYGCISKLNKAREHRREAWGASEAYA
jgi:hypothetical protein